jgi:hypothetical protein
VTVPAPTHEDAPVVLRDVFPAEVWVDGVVYRTARAIVTRERVYVWQAEGRQQLLRLDEAYLPESSTVPRYNAGPREETRLQLRDSEPGAMRALVVRRQRGCGCGSSLRGWRPWNPYRVAAS